MNTPNSALLRVATPIPLIEQIRLLTSDMDREITTLVEYQKKMSKEYLESLDFDSLRQIINNILFSLKEIEYVPHQRYANLVIQEISKGVKNKLNTKSIGGNCNNMSSEDREDVKGVIIHMEKQFIELKIGVYRRVLEDIKSILQQRGIIEE